MWDFVYNQPARRVVFGPGSIAQLRAEAQRLGVTRAVVISMPTERHLAEDASARLGNLSVGVYAEVAAQHVPIELLATAREYMQTLDVDGYVAIGGGSTVGVAKGLALQTGLPIIAVPTTYAGSEMTSIYGITEDRVKKTGRDARVRPRTVIYDVGFTLSLPPAIAGPSGMNAMAHCVEALYTQDTNPFVVLMAAEGIRALSWSLPVVVKQPDDVIARSQAQYAAWLAGMSLESAGTALHHKLCHTLGGSFNLPHAETHTVVLPHATAYNRDAVPEAMRTAAEALGAHDAAQGLFDLVERIGAPSALKDIGMPADGLDAAAELATRDPYWNPRPVERSAIRGLLDDAFHGRRPRLG